MYGSCQRSSGITPRYASAAVLTIARIASRSSSRHARMRLISSIFPSRRASLLRVDGLSRRQALAGLGSVSLGAVLAACGSDDDDNEAAAPAETTEGTEFDSAATCTQTAELTEGPFYFDVDKIRSDIREDREGAELRLGIRVRDAADCSPLSDAVVDIWHCDATGNYSADGETYLRGAQVTAKDGVAEFTTIYPGWYPGRTVHIHAKVHIDSRRCSRRSSASMTNSARRCSRRSPTPPTRGARRSTSDGLYSEELELTLPDEVGCRCHLVGELDEVPEDSVRVLDLRPMADLLIQVHDVRVRNQLGVPLGHVAPGVRIARTVDQPHRDIRRAHRRDPA